MFAAVDHLAGVADFVRGEVGGASQMLAASAGGFDPCAAAFPTSLRSSVMRTRGSMPLSRIARSRATSGTAGFMRAM